MPSMHLELSACPVLPCYLLESKIIRPPARRFQARSSVGPAVSFGPRAGFAAVDSHFLPSGAEYRHFPLDARRYLLLL